MSTFQYSLVTLKSMLKKCMALKCARLYTVGTYLNDAILILVSANILDIVRGGLETDQLREIKK